MSKLYRTHNDVRGYTIAVPIEDVHIGEKNSRWCNLTADRSCDHHYEQDDVYLGHGLLPVGLGGETAQISSTSAMTSISAGPS